MEPVPLSEALDQMLRRMLQECMQERYAAVWRKRAEQFESARPRKTDFHGNASADELHARDDLCARTALACRRHADLIESGECPDFIAAEITEVLRLAA